MFSKCCLGKSCVGKPARLGLDVRREEEHSGVGVHYMCNIYGLLLTAS